MATNVYATLDLNLNEIKNVKIDIVTTDPASPQEGQVWYNSTSQLLKLRKNGATVQLAEGDFSQAITRSAAAGAANCLIVSAGADKTAKTYAGGAGIIKSDANGAVSAATADTDYATPGYVDTQVASVAEGLSWKDTVRAATTTAGNLATDFANGQAIDGVTLATGDRILVKDQADETENGIRVVASSGAPARATDMNASAEFTNAILSVTEGTTNAGTTWRCTSVAPTVGSSDIIFASFGTIIPSASTTVQGKVELATTAETEAKTDTDRAVTPSGLSTFARKYSADITNSASGTIVAATHGLGATKYLTACVFESGTPNALVIADITVAANGDVSWATSENINGYIVIIG